MLTTPRDTIIAPPTIPPTLCLFRLSGVSWEIYTLARYSHNNTPPPTSPHCSNSSSRSKAVHPPRSLEQLQLRRIQLRDARKRDLYRIFRVSLDAVGTVLISSAPSSFSLRSSEYLPGILTPILIWQIIRTDGLDSAGPARLSAVTFQGHGNGGLDLPLSR